MNRLSGYTVTRNARRLDYPIQLTIKSLLPICDEVVVCDSDSDDGTREMLEGWASVEPKLKVINYPWPNPKGDSFWFVKWLNFTREHLSHEMQLELDADEVLDDSEACHQVIRGAVREGACRTFDRLNFWGSPGTLIPDGYCCGKWVTRLGPSVFFMPSDEPRHAGECEILDKAVRHQDLKIFHLGFLRKQEAFYAKSKVVLEAFFNRWDTRLEEGEKQGKPVAQTECEYKDKLVPYHGPFPGLVAEWLRDRGHRTIPIFNISHE